MDSDEIPEYVSQRTVFLQTAYGKLAYCICKNCKIPAPYWNPYKKFKRQQRMARKRRRGYA